MARIRVENGNWDKARADLGTMLDAKRNSFNAQFEAAFGTPRKQAEVTAQAAKPALAKKITAKSASGLILSRPRSK